MRCSRRRAPERARRDQIEHRDAAVCPDEHILGLEVAVNDALVVQVAEDARQPDEHRGRVPQPAAGRPPRGPRQLRQLLQSPHPLCPRADRHIVRQLARRRPPPEGRDLVEQRPPLQQLHGHPGHLVPGTCPPKPDDARMVEAFQSPDLTMQTRNLALVPVSNRFQGDQLARPHILGLENRSHAPVSQPIQQLKSPQSGGGDGSKVGKIRRFRGQCERHGPDLQQPPCHAHVGQTPRPSSPIC
jgi:hypothetical protein